MKAQSPAHKLIQLRRKTEKIVIPKASWDLSNKENNNISNNYDITRSKNSSKKNSLEKMEKRSGMKKTLSTTQNMLKCTLKNITKNTASYKENKDTSLDKKRTNKKNQSKIDTSIISKRNFVENMGSLLEMAKKGDSINNLTLKYAKQLMKFTPNNENERIIFSTLSEHLIFWLQKCQELQKSKQEPTSKNFIEFEQVDFATSQHGSAYDEEESEGSVCSYIVDPQQKIQMKPIRQDLKQQLQLNFAKVDYLRKKQIQ